MTTEKNETTEQISELHPKDNKNVVVYPKTKSEAIIDRIDKVEMTDKVVTGEAVANSLDGVYSTIDEKEGNLNSKINEVNDAVTTLDTKTEDMNKVIPTDISYKDGFTLMHDSEEITGQTEKITLGDNLEYDSKNKKIKSKNEVEFSKVTIPSSSDIVTKDGTRIGGDEYYKIQHTFDVNEEMYQLSLKEYEEIYNGGNPKNLIINETVKLKSAGYTAFGESTILLYKGFDLNFGNAEIFSYYCSIFHNDNIAAIYIRNVDVPMQVTFLTGGFASLSSQDISEGDIRLQLCTINNEEIANTANEQRINLSLATKQECWAQYRHTIDIVGTNSAGVIYISLRFTTLSSKNTPVDSIQDLLTLFANTKLGASGSMNNNDDDTILAIIKGINVGTSVSNTMIEFTDKTTESLASYGTDLTIADDVTQD